MTDAYDVVVVGAGLAGLAAALELAPTRRVLVLDAADRAGGQLAGGWRDGRAADLGVHGVYPRYRELERLLAAAGVRRSQLIPADGQYVVDDAGAVSPIRMPPLPAPFHGVYHAARLSRVPVRERARLAAASRRLLALEPTRRDLASRSIAEVAQAAGVPAGAFRLVFEPLTWIGFFLPPEETSAAAYLSAMRFLISGRSDSWRAAWVRAPNGETLVRPLVERAEESGVRFALGARATAIVAADGAATGVQVEERAGVRTVGAGAVVCAAQPLDAAPLVAPLPEGEAVARALRRLGSTAVHTYRVRFSPGDRAVARHGVALTASAGFVFFALHEFMPAYADGGERVLEIQCAPAALDGGLDVEHVIRDLLPDGRTARLLDAERVEPVPYARYATENGGDRPSVRTPWRNIVLAGDWVEDDSGGWFMERAVATGRVAARALLGDPTPLAARALEGPGVRLARRLGSARA